jgi:hypothetical protein
MNNSIGYREEMILQDKALFPQKQYLLHKYFNQNKH